MPLKFITGEPALLISRSLVIADLHLGAEHDYRAAGIMMPSRTQDMQASIESLLRKTKASRLIIIGDVKHRVPGTSFQEEKEVPTFLSKLAHKTSVEVVPGNHDGGLARLSPDVVMRPSEGTMLGGFWLCHGHAWPPAEALKAEAIIIGHNHSQVEFCDRLGKVWREKVWVRTELKRKPMSAHYKKLPKKLPGLILMPAFNPLVGGWAVNKPNDEGELVGGLGPITKCADIGHALAYMLDGTFLGEVGGLNSAHKPR